ncbi:P-loop containing nucleoside triphosphate hydrolase [Arabidopsis thaliana x Arabidopsis arenosa]|uniref:Sulfotransferase n=2 Tax=Arabidopsis TaxID=3701 RepID=A0A8T1YNS1_ARASU|nr:P-loop containing nucleoside triphosphate hydrolase [Arabidopsis thaliana x Arabidopsis arenosa]KAG7547740.1 P-loop containing nucleoside triphosphate hydrolase [Arabidopsis suecica]
MNQSELLRNFGDDEDIRPEVKSLISSLPSYTDVEGKKLCNYQGCWYYYKNLQAVLDYQKNFKPLDTDIIVTSYPKSGTTWLKALTVALLQRSEDGLQNHPLTSDSPHGLVPFLEMKLYLKSSTPDLTNLSSSPRLFSTHMPLHTLREPLKDSPCKIVYVCRNVKDVIVSLWHFRSRIENKEAERSKLESIVESFCKGVNNYGPFWDNVLSYWKGSLEDPDHVLFMRYEDLKEEPYDQVIRLAEFLGCPFTQEEIHSGSVEKILDLCSLDNLRNLDINKSGIAWNKLHHSIFFRKGEVDDWKNHLTTEMADKIDMIIHEKFQGSGLRI